MRDAALPPASDEDTAAERWSDALTAAQLLAIDPSGLGGAVVAAGPGPVRDGWIDYLRALADPSAPFRRMPAMIDDDRLLGGIDLAATLGTGRPVLQRGLLAEADGGFIVIPMAERLPAGTAARVAAAIDCGEVALARDGIAARQPARICVIALDEGAATDEQVPATLRQRLAFPLDLSGIRAFGFVTRQADRDAIIAARQQWRTIPVAADAILGALVATAAAFGIDTVTAPLLALRAARAAAALAGRDHIATPDAVLATRLVLAPRALVIPAAEEAPAEDDTEPTPPAEPESGSQEEVDPAAVQAELEDVLRAAVEAALPEGLLDGLVEGRRPHTPPARRQGAGQAQTALRGRPAGTRSGSLKPGARLALVDTLRAAAPWQPVRRREIETSGGERVVVRREDFRIRKFVQRRESTIVFCVDASGSTAFQRLAEAKGAVELLLAKAYVARTFAALIVFRGTTAEMLLPPTRSLARAKALLADLPGGGGTPLAAGIDLAVATALAERVRGREPLIVMLTDGRANIGRDGTAARTRAAEDAQDAARQVALAELVAVFVDTAPRPRGEAADLAATMAARYVALPYVEAAAVYDAVQAATPDRVARRHR
jgi:magnesium chelatase subunit D